MTLAEDELEAIEKQWADLEESITADANEIASWAKRDISMLADEIRRLQAELRDA